MAEIIALAERRAKLPAAGSHMVRHEVITDKLVKSLLASGVPQRVRDTEIGGFWIDIKGESKASAFRVQADLPKKARRRGKSPTLTRTLGRYPDLSVRAARAAAQLFLGSIKRGEDPNPKKPEPSPDGPTLDEAWQRYREALAKKGRRPSTILHYEGCLKRLRASWHDDLLADIGADRPAVAAEHTRISNECGSVAGDQTMRFLRAVFNHARRSWPDLPANPVVAVDFNGTPSNSNDGMGPADLPVWWERVNTIKNPIRRELLLFMLLSGLRSGDARTTKAEHLNIRDRTLFLPEPKGGERRRFHLPLSRAMLRCIWRARRAAQANCPQQARVWLFPSPSSAKGCFTDARVEQRNDGERDRSLKTGHDLRHTFSNLAQAAGLPEEITSVLMNHKRSTMTSQYQNPAALRDFYRDQMERVSRTIIEAMVPDQRGLM
jgi:integrase